MPTAESIAALSVQLFRLTRGLESELNACNRPCVAGEGSIQRLVRPPLALQFLDCSGDLTPDGSTPDVPSPASTAVLARSKPRADDRRGISGIASYAGPRKASGRRSFTLWRRPVLSVFHTQRGVRGAIWRQKITHPRVGCLPSASLTTVPARIDSPSSLFFAASP